MYHACIDAAGDLDSSLTQLDRASLAKPAKDLPRTLRGETVAAGAGGTAGLLSVESRKLSSAGFCAQNCPVHDALLLASKCLDLGKHREASSEMAPTKRSLRKRSTIYPAVRDYYVDPGRLLEYSMSIYVAELQNYKK